MQLAIGFLLACLIGILSWRIGALTRSGGLAAILTGTLIFGLGGIPWASLLLMFFISSSALSRLFSKRKKTLNEKFSKDSRRDWGQVLANGGLGALMAVVAYFFPQEIWPWIAFSGAMAAVNADTWATEIGVLNPHPPRLITNGHQVEGGTSGAVSLLGSLASLSGSAVIAILAAWLSVPKPNSFLAGMEILIIVTLGGVLGSFFDSLLGATIQAIYYCPVCQKETEKYPIHTCGTTTQHKKGWTWLNNDWVNFFCSLAGAIASMIFFYALI
jgi:uncharacterized protein (TIGR00297 family)